MNEGVSNDVFEEGGEDSSKDANVEDEEDKPGGQVNSDNLAAKSNVLSQPPAKKVK